MESSQVVEDLGVVDLHIIGRKRENDKHSDQEDGREQASQPFQLDISVPKSTPLLGLWDKIAEAGFELPDYIVCGGRNWYKYSTKFQAPSFEEIEVVHDRPSEPGKCIHIDDSLISYANLQYGKPLELNIAEDASTEHMSGIDSLKDSRGLEITFHRTIRMPDDDKIHQLPGSLGTFPIYNVAAYAEALPDRIVRDGGVFMPMWQREALWINLSANWLTPYALRFSVGRINAVSGSQMDQIPGNMTNSKPIQDYVVVPGQEWIDGVCVAPGIVRQFVAMPLGSGYTIEGQKTGEEKYGGLQIEIIPSFQNSLRNWLKAADSSPDPDELETALRKKLLDEYKTPSEMKLDIGTYIRSFPAKSLPPLECMVSDILGRDGSNFEVELMYYEDFSDRRFRPLSSSGDMVPQLRKMGYPRPMGASYSDENSVVRQRYMPDTSIDTLGYTKETTTSLYPSFSRGSTKRSKDPAQPADRGTTSIPQISTKDLTAMGLAAGGKLVQDIYRDRKPARTWNTAAARIVHVHILDPASCEAVTHIVPPPPPIDAMGYAEGGGQFFVVEEQPEGRLDGGDFDNVKSVSAMDKEKAVSAEAALDLATPMQCRCGIRMCDCVVRPCGHVFCNVCIREIDSSALGVGFQKAHASDKRWKCLTCEDEISWVAGFAAPMNLPGEEGLKVRVPVNVLKVEDGRVAFRSIQKARI